jgi:hypothetical protein
MSEVELTTKQRNKIKRAIKALNDVRREIQEQNPDCDMNWYLEDAGNFHLLDSESHDENCCANRDGVVDSFNLYNSGGGGW